ncbi:MAG: hypothetical protein U0169_04450 [Polyangiaceae bacterium]
MLPLSSLSRTVRSLLAIATCAPATFAVSGCAHDPHRPDAAFVASCSPEAAELITRPDAIAGVEAHWDLRKDQLEHHLRGAKLHLAAPTDAAQLQDALRCKAARAERTPPWEGKGPLEVSEKMPSIVVTTKGTQTTVVIEGLTDAEGERILASAKRIVGRE